MALALKENLLLDMILTEYQNDAILMWRASATLESREQASAVDRAITLLRKRINERISRELGDKQPKQSAE